MGVVAVEDDAHADMVIYDCPACVDCLRKIRDADVPRIHQINGRPNNFSSSSANSVQRLAREPGASVSRTMALTAGKHADDEPLDAHPYATFCHAMSYN